MKSEDLVGSFNYAADGIIHALKTQRNMRIHFLTAAVVLVTSLFLGLSKIEFIALFLTITFVVVAELFNTAIEAAIDVTTNTYDPIARVAKDMAAAAVLLAAINAIAIGYIIFFDKVTGVSIGTIRYIMVSPIHTTIVALLLVLMLTILLKMRSRKGSIFEGGMPSAHSALAFSLWTAVTIVGYFNTTGRITVFISSLVLIMALLVSQTRVEAKIHTPTEVSIGAVLGFLTTVLVFQFYIYLNS